MNADNATKSAVGKVEKTIVAMSDTKQENNAFPWLSALIRVHLRLSLLRTVNGYRDFTPGTLQSPALRASRIRALAGAARIANEVISNGEMLHTHESGHFAMTQLH